MSAGKINVQFSTPSTKGLKLITDTKTKKEIYPKLQKHYTKLKKYNSGLQLGIRYTPFERQSSQKLKIRLPLGLFSRSLLRSIS